MKRIAILFSTAAMLLTLVLSASAKSKTENWTGWISDSGCGAKGMAASHKDCAVTCVHQKGAKWVFINSETQQVFPIQNQKAVNDSDVGMEVQLAGKLTKNQSIHVDSIQPAH